jgi:hypothetical protein
MSYELNSLESTFESPIIKINLSQSNNENLKIYHDYKKQYIEHKHKITIENWNFHNAKLNDTSYEKTLIVHTVHDAVNLIIQEPDNFFRLPDKLICDKIFVAYFMYNFV